MGFPSRKIAVLMYHEIYLPPERQRLVGVTNPGYNTELSLFRRQMAWLAANGYRTVTIGDISSGRLPDASNVTCITFDDGWRGNYAHAFAVLKEYGMRATFFVATGLIGRPLYMEWAHLREMQASGMSIQSHTVSHLPLWDRPEEELVFELSESKNRIESELGAPVLHLSLPHGVQDRRVYHLAQKLGYKTVSTSEVGYHREGAAGPLIKRIAIGDNISDARFRGIAGGKQKAILGMIVLKAGKNLLRRVVGVARYRRLYHRVYGIQ